MASSPDDHARTNPLVPQLKVGDMVEYWLTFPFQEEIVYSAVDKKYILKSEPTSGIRGQRTKRGPDMVCDIVTDDGGKVTVWLDLIIDVDFQRKEPILRKIPVEYIIGIVDRV
jgi:hypothetical protein